MNATSIFQNEHRWVIEGQVDLSAAAAVGDSRGTNMVWARTAVGTYTCTVKGTTATRMYEALKASAFLSDAATLAGALEARISGIAQATDGTDDVVITVLTCNETGAAADTTAAVTLNIDVVLRTTPMTAW